MFERFTERARQVVVLAQDEARAMKHDYIGTEHLLLGSLREEEGIAARALRSLGVALEDARGQVARIVGFGDEHTVGQIPFTPRGKKVLELSDKEARALGHRYIGTEHILLGIVRENEGVASRILLDLGADAGTIRTAVLDLLEGYDVRMEISPAQTGPSRPVRISVSRSPGDRFWDRPESWIWEHSASIAGTIMLCVGVLVGWLIWG